MRKLIPLSPRLDGDLESYVAAARAESHQIFVTAAAIGLASLSIAPALNAEIVYTPANETVGGMLGVATLQIDLNNDGVPDFVLTAYNYVTFTTIFQSFRYLNARGLQSNQILNSHNQGNLNLALADAQGQMIGPTTTGPFKFGSRGEMNWLIFEYDGDGNSWRSSRGFWLNATNRYLGIKFYIDGEIHYGWARLNAHAGYAQLTGYAYETIPNKPIRAGVLPTPESNAAPQKPATLGVLAMGASQLNRPFGAHTSH
jgi:hypothetical protein